MENRAYDNCDKQYIQNNMEKVRPLYVVDPSQTITRDSMTLFEFVSALSATERQLEDGCPSFVDPADTLHNTALKHILEKKSPLIVQRKPGYALN
jgi:hypothetical protein